MAGKTVGLDAVGLLPQWLSIFRTAGSISRRTRVSNPYSGDCLSSVARCRIRKIRAASTASASKYVNIGTDSLYPGLAIGSIEKYVGSTKLRAQYHNPSTTVSHQL